MKMLINDIEVKVLQIETLYLPHRIGRVLVVEVEHDNQMKDFGRYSIHTGNLKSKVHIEFENPYTHECEIHDINGSFHVDEYICMNRLVLRVRLKN